MINSKTKILEDYSKTYSDMVGFTSNRNLNTTDEIWLVEHNSVFTQGKHGKAEHILDLGDTPLIQTDRGGQVTYHGPGQAVIYFLLDIKRIGIGAKSLVSIIEKSCQKMLKDEFNIESHTIENAHGIYVDNKKISSIGLRIKQGKTYHGISINVDMDISYFGKINPCGYSGLQMCNISDYNKTNANVEYVLNAYKNLFVKELKEYNKI